MKIAVVVVTYNRLSLLKNNLNSLLAQSYKPNIIYLIDNASTDGTYEYCQEMQTKYCGFIEHYRMTTNAGGAGGFEKGIQIAYENDADYIWGMDDDAVPDLNALEILIKATNRFPPDKYCLRSNTYYIDEKGKFVLEQVSDHDQKNAGLTFVGFFISREIISRVGYPRGDLFIYYDEVDYTLTIRECGYEIVGIKESIIRHPYIMPLHIEKLFGRNVKIPEMPKWKLYYWMRNNLLIRKQGDRQYGYAVILGFYNLLKIFVFKREQFGVALRGYLDGIRGVSGHKKDLP